MNVAKMDFLQSVPRELLNKVASYLDDADLDRLRDASLQAKRDVKKDDPVLVKEMCSARSNSFESCGLASFFADLERSGVCDKECRSLASRETWKKNLSFASWLPRVQYAFIEFMDDGEYQFLPVSATVRIDFDDGRSFHMESSGIADAGQVGGSGGTMEPIDQVQQRIDRRIRDGDVPVKVFLSLAPKTTKRKLISIADPFSNKTQRVRVTFFDLKDHIGPRYFVGFTGWPLRLAKDDRDIELAVFGAALHKEKVDEDATVAGEVIFEDGGSEISESEIVLPQEWPNDSTPDEAAVPMLFEDDSDDDM